MRIAFLLAFLLSGTFLAAALASPSVHVDPAVRSALSANGSAEVIVVLRPDLAVKGGRGIQSASARSFASASLSVNRRLESLNMVTGRLSEQGLSALTSDPSVSAVYWNRPVQAHDAGSNAQINADDVQAFSFQGQNLSGQNQTICVIDTGIDYRDPAFGSCSSVGSGGSCRVLAGYDYANDDGDPLDDNFHGTHVAGIAAANGSSLTGVAPGANLVVMKALNAAGSGSLSDVVAAIDACTSNRTAYNISVISMSLGGGSSTTACDGELDAQALADAQTAGIFSAVSSGNNGFTDKVSLPACASAAAAIGSVNSVDAVASTSNDWPNFLLLAPGVSINSTTLSNTTTVLSGTSMAAPHVAGAAALLQEYAQRGNGSLATPSYLRLLLNRTGVAVVDSKSGNRHYRIDALTALRAFQSDVSPRNFSLDSFSNASVLATTYALVNVSFADDDAPTGCTLAWANGSTTNFSMTLGTRSCQFNVTGQSSGSAVFTAFVNDSFGNLANASFSVSFDSDAPLNVTLSLSNNSIVAVSYAEINVTFTESLPDSCILELDGVNTSVSANASWCFFNQSLSDGNHSVLAFVNDTSGRLNSSVNISFTVDATPPVSLAFSAPSPSNASFLFQNYLYYNLTFTEVRPDSCLLWQNGTAFSMTATGSGSGAYCELNRTSLSDGQYDAFVQVNDTAGHLVNSSLLSVFLDTVPPSGLVLVSPTLSNNSNSSDDFLFVNLSFTETNPASCFLSVNGTANNTVALTSADADGYCSYNLSSLADGTYNYTLYAQDQAGRQNSTGFFTLVIDTTAPASLAFGSPTPSNGSFSSQNYLFYNLSFTETHPDACTLWANGTALNMSVSGSYCELNRTSLSDGQYESFVQVNDSAGNSANSSTLTLYLDASAPVIFGLSTSASAVNASTAFSVTLNATDALSLANVTLFLVNASGTVLSNQSPLQNGANYAFSLGALSLSEGNYTVNATATDNASNTASNTSLNVTVDATVPVAPALSTAANASGFVYLNWSGASDTVGIDHYEILRNGSTIASTSAQNATDQNAAPLTTYVYAVWVYDLAGNANASANASVTTNDSTAPQVSGNVSAANQANGAVNVSWQNVTSDVLNQSEFNVTYSVYRSANTSETNLSAFTFLANASNLYYLDGSALDADTAYLYLVVSMDAANNSNTTLGSNRLNHTTVSSCSNAFSGFSACSGGSKSQSRVCLGSTQTLTQACTVEANGGGSGGSGGGGGGGGNRGELFVISEIPKSLPAASGSRTETDVVIASYYTGFLRNLNLTLTGVPRDWYTIEAPQVVTPISNTSLKIIWHPPKNATGNHSVTVALAGVGTKSAGILNASYAFTLVLPPAQTLKPAQSPVASGTRTEDVPVPLAAPEPVAPAETDYSGFVVALVVLLIGGVLWFGHEHRRWDDLAGKKAGAKGARKGTRTAAK